MLDGKTIEIEVDENSTWLNIKEKIFTELNIPVSEQTHRSHRKGTLRRLLHRPPNDRDNPPRRHSHARPGGGQVFLGLGPAFRGEKPVPGPAECALVPAETGLVQNAASGDSTRQCRG